VARVRGQLQTLKLIS